MLGRSRSYMQPLDRPSIFVDLSITSVAYLERSGKYRNRPGAFPTSTEPMSHRPFWGCTELRWSTVKRRP